MAGVALMVAFCALAPLSDAAVKLIGTALPLLLVVLTRFAFQVLLLAPFALRELARWRPGRRELALLLARSAAHVLAIMAMFLALRALPLAEAIAIVYVQPFLMLLLAVPLLGERAGPARLLACLAGLLGTVMVLRPSLAEAGTAALWPLAAALAFTAFMLLTRGLVRQAGPLVLQVAGGAMSLLLLVPLALVVPLGLMQAAPPDIARELTLVWPETREAGLLLAMGLIATAAHLALTWSLRHAPTATLAPVQYMEMPFAILIGLLVFGDFPDSLALAGIVVIIVAGLAMVRQEGRARPAPPAPPPAPPGAG